jgi:hypothetical protein
MVYTVKRREIKMTETKSFWSVMDLDLPGIHGSEVAKFATREEAQAYAAVNELANYWISEGMAIALF